MAATLQRAKLLDLVYFAPLSLSGSEVACTYACDLRGGKTREVEMMRSEVMHGRARWCVSSTFSKSCYLYSWLHELKERPRSGFLNMAAGRPRTVIQSRFFQLDQTVALFSVCRSGRQERPWSPPSFALSFLASPSSLPSSSRLRWRFTRARNPRSRIPSSHLCRRFSRVSRENVIHRLSRDIWLIIS